MHGLRVRGNGSVRSAHTKRQIDLRQLVVQRELGRVQHSLAAKVNVRPRVNEDVVGRGDGQTTRRGCKQPIIAGIRKQKQQQWQ